MDLETILKVAKHIISRMRILINLDWFLLDMNLEDLMLKKEEIPILHDCCFQVPIHPKLLDSEIKLDQNLARTTFPKAAEEWYNDLVEYSKKLEDDENKKWISEVFLKKRPKIIKKYASQELDTLGWQDQFFTLENGFAYSLSISRDAGGSLYFHEDDTLCEVFVPFNASTGYIRFPKEKALEYSKDDLIIKLGSGSEGVEVYIYASHNIDYYPGALFLRNWTILYLNEAMKQVLK